MPYKYIIIDGESRLVNIINSDEISHKCLVDTEPQIPHIHKSHNIKHIETDLEVLDQNLNNPELETEEKGFLKEEKKILLERKNEYLINHDPHPFVNDNGKFYKKFD